MSAPDFSGRKLSQPLKLLNACPIKRELLMGVVHLCQKNGPDFKTALKSPTASGGWVSPWGADGFLKRVFKMCFCREGRKPSCIPPLLSNSRASS